MLGWNIDEKELEEFGLAPKDKRNKRMELCKECPSFLEKTYRCNHCGCFTPVMVWINSRECPEKKW